MKQFVIGRNPVLEVLKGKRKVEIIYIQKNTRGPILEIEKEAKKRKIHIEEVDKKSLDNMSKCANHQGAIAIVEEYKYGNVEDILSLARDREEAAFIIILDKIEDPHNLGAIIRTAETAGAHGIIIPERRSAQVTETVLRASAGAAEHMIVARVNNISQTISYLKDQGLWIYGSCIDGDIKYYEADLKGPIALIIGNEGRGTSQKIKENADQLLTIPMRGRLNSLNASNAAAILIYEVMRQNYG